jgi:23S rRNA (uracil1939-C5)-methyltransferase
MHSPPDSFIVNLTTHTYGGETLGRLPDGRAVFVPFAMPGEEVRIRLIDEKRGYARAELIEVLTPSPTRIKPVCKHFTTCGGCHYQHMSYETQLSAKKNILRDQLERLGKIEDPPVKPTVSSPRHYQYRNSIQFQVTEQGSLGFYETQADDIFAIQECHLPEEMLNLLWPKLDFEPGTGLERVCLRLGKDEDILLILESNEPEPPEFMVEDLPISAIYLGPDEVHVLAGNSYTVIEVLERPFRVSAASFFQVNTPMAAVMVTHVLDNLDLKSTDTVIDAFAGVGLFSVFLAPRIKRLLAIEDAPQACADFVYNLDEFDNVELYQGKVEDILPVLEVKPQAILVDPPRAGLDRYVVDGILDMQPEVLVYVSCDAATLARDSQRLTGGGYRLEDITPFDLFPQTYHIESISFWHR